MYNRDNTYSFSSSYLSSRNINKMYTYPLSFEESDGATKSKFKSIHFFQQNGGELLNKTE